MQEWLAFVLALFAGAVPPRAPAKSEPSTVEVQSPDGQVRIHFELSDSGTTKSAATYSISYRGRPVLLDSHLGLTFESSGMWGTGLRILGVKVDRHRGKWNPIYGERDQIPDNYDEARINLEEKTPALRRISIILRAYNEGAAFRYSIPRQNGISDFVLISEQSEFSLPPGTRAWETHGAQRPYENVWAKDIQPQCERPLVIEYPDGTVAALAEAGTRNYGRMLFSPVPSQPWKLVSELSSGPAVLAGTDPLAAAGVPRDRAPRNSVWGSAPFSSPWRVMIVGDRPGDLIERNYLLLNLNDPPSIKDTSWIRPGKIIREVTLSTQGARECVDFAKQRNLQYIEFDAGWYGREYDDASDATGVNVDPLRLQRDPAYQGLDLPGVIRYAADNNIGIFLYVNRRALEKQLTTILPLYEKWGIKGVKFGFVNVGSQYWTRWLYDAVELAAKHKLMVDIHDEHRPTGLSRTLPNLLTQEGIHGNEEMPSPDHNTVLPFTRFIAGAADYTICYYNERIKTTRAHQLALAVVYYSPLQFMYWYDRPAAYQGEPEVEFFDRVPTVWNQTRVMDGQIGRFVTVARQSGNDWFVGTINNSVPRSIRIPLSFLPAGRRYSAHVYENGRASKEVKISTRPADSSTTIEAVLPAGGGQAIWFEPQNR